MSALTSFHSSLQPFLTPIHPYLPFALLDLYGASRLSSVVNWFATGAFDPTPSERVGAKKGAPGKRRGGKRERASLLQELFGLMVIVFGGETFLCMCSGATPSWLMYPASGLLFGIVHTLQTHTFLIALLPSKPDLPLELTLAIPDAIARVLLLTQFSVTPLIHPQLRTPALPATPSTLLLVPFILAVPGAAIIFTGTSWFSPIPSFATPAELKPWGWTAVDVWAPIVVPAAYLMMIGPVRGWKWGLGWREDEGMAACIIGLSVVFLLRAVYNLGYRREQWTEMLGVRKTIKMD